jgi:hypothetical protein
VVTTEGQVEDVEMGTLMVEAMERAGRGMAPVHLNGRHNSTISRSQGHNVNMSELTPLTPVCRVQLVTSNNNLSLQNLVWQKRKDRTAGGANVVDILTMSTQLTLIASYVIRRTRIYHGNVQF